MALYSIQEYNGYLMSGLYSRMRAYNYVCIDKSPDTITDLQGNKNGAVMYMVQANCPSLGHCPPYIDRAELTCIVCSKCLASYICLFNEVSKETIYHLQVYVR